jgi:hypothetical protein
MLIGLEKQLRADVERRAIALADSNALIAELGPVQVTDLLQGGNAPSRDRRG